ncbi:TPA: DEAD/DEAH box helicase [Enterococcus hirae]
MENNLFFKCNNFVLPDKWKESMEKFASTIDDQVFIIREPLSKEDALYEYKDAFVILIPGYKIMILNFGREEKEFEEFYEDFLEDLAYLSDKYSYKSKLGRPRVWKNEHIAKINHTENPNDFFERINEFKQVNESSSRISDLLISLLTGSINDISNINIEEPQSILEKVKQKIVLFDGQQTRFIFEDIPNKIVRIQGLAGTGKTELLLHKLKELYINPNKYKIGFTCFSKTLASNLRQRVPEFFTFMKVEEQIEWNTRLSVFHSWGSGSLLNSGLYASICQNYSIPFYSLKNGTFEQVCKKTVEDLKTMNHIEPMYDYLLIDESQDFSDSFFELCSLVTRHTVYLAGDIFQTIFDNQINGVKPDFLLNKVYRTDPRTLMFAQAIGLGLLERPVINWLSDREFSSCGYIIEKDNDKYILSREKIRRFEDINEEEEICPVHLENIEYSQVVSQIIDVINIIKNEHITVTPNDIGIVFIDSDSYIYSKIDELENRIYDEFGWEINRGFDNKGEIKDKIFISNRNNIKGLEFPFVICITCKPISKSISLRNVLYMTMTRSFISSYLILADQDEELVQTWEKGLLEILSTSKLMVKKPATEDILSKDDLRIEEAQYQTLEEMKNEVFKKYGITSQEEQDVFNTILNAHYKAHKDLTKQGIDKIVRANREVMSDDY